MVTNITVLIIYCCCVYLIIIVCLGWFGVKLGRNARKTMDDDNKYEGRLKIANILDLSQV